MTSDSSARIDPELIVAQLTPKYLGAYGVTRLTVYDDPLAGSVAHGQVLCLGVNEDFWSLISRPSKFIYAIRHVSLYAGILMAMNEIAPIFRPNLSEPMFLAQDLLHTSAPGRASFERFLYMTELAEAGGVRYHKVPSASHLEPPPEGYVLATSRVAEFLANYDGWGEIGQNWYAVVMVPDLGPNRPITEADAEVAAERTLYGYPLVADPESRFMLTQDLIQLLNTTPVATVAIA